MKRRRSSIYEHVIYEPSSSTADSSTTFAVKPEVIITQSDDVTSGDVKDEEEDEPCKKKARNLVRDPLDEVFGEIKMDSDVSFEKEEFKSGESEYFVSKT